MKTYVYVSYLTGPRFIVVLGAHHISGYSSGSKALSSKSYFPPKDRTVLYNFKYYIDGQADFYLSQNTHMWQVYDHYSLIGFVGRERYSFHTACRLGHYNQVLFRAQRGSRCLSS